MLKPEFAEACLAEMNAEVKATVITPGGRIGNDARRGSRSNGENWVERSKSGSLPRYIRIIRNGIMKDGHSESRATALAVAAVKRWARGGDNVSPKVRAAAAKAVAEWEAMKAGKADQVAASEEKRERPNWDADEHPRHAAGTSGGGRFKKKKRDDDQPEGDPKDGKTHEVGSKPGTIKINEGDTLSELAEQYQTTVEELLDLNPLIKDRDLIYAGADLRIPGGTRTKKRKGASESREQKTSPGSISGQDDSDIEMKDGPMGLEYKEVGVSGVTVLDADEGVVETLVSVTGVVDNVKDVILPGSYEKSLKTRTPKGVWSHTWDKPISRTVEVKELLPGDERLPDTLPNGNPWPAEAGALYVKTQFNLETQRGREAYSDVVFFGDEQEWSIGYQVPVGGAKVDSKTGQRHISHLELYEYSPVLFGAMSSARTQNVKDAQVALKQITLPAVEFKTWLDDMGLAVKGGDGAKPEDEESEDDDQSPEDDADAFDEAESDADSDDSADDPDDEYDEEEDDDEEEKAYPFVVTAYEREVLVKTRAAIDSILDRADLIESNPEFKGGDYEGDDTKTVTQCIADKADALGDLADELSGPAQAYEEALSSGDNDAAITAGEELLALVESAMDEADDDAVSALQGVAKAVADTAPTDQPEDEDDTEKKGGMGKPCPPGMKKKKRKPLPGKPSGYGAKSLDDQGEDEPESTPVVLGVKELDAFRVGFRTKFGR